MNKEARNNTKGSRKPYIFSLKATGLSHLIKPIKQLLRVIFNYAIDNQIIAKPFIITRRKKGFFPVLKNKDTTIRL